jgi:hypothetical protein
VEVTDAFPDLTVTKQSFGGGTGTVQSSPAGINCGSMCSAQFRTGSQVTLTATPNPGSFFLGWSGGACSGSVAPACVVTMGGDTTVTATFGTG